MTRTILAILALALLGNTSWSQDRPAFPAKSKAATPQSPDAILAFLGKHCQTCHGSEKAKGKFRVNILSPDFADGANRDRWLAVLRRVQAGEMPPKRKPRPSAKEISALTSWISARAAAAERARRAAEGRVVLRRLNRAEYSNTVRDLLGIDVDLREQLARDNSVDGFDNVGAGLRLSSFALDRYLEAADNALKLAIVDRAAPAKMKQRYTLKDQHSVKSLGKEYCTVLGDGTLVLSISVPYTIVWLQQFDFRERGYYRFRISASGYQSSGKPITFSVQKSLLGAIAYHDVPADKPTTIEFVTQMDPYKTSVGILPYGLRKATLPAGYKGPGLRIHWAEVEGPLYDTWPPASHRRIFGSRKQALVKDRSRLEVVSTDPQADAEKIVRDFAQRAFRRPVRDDELKPYFKIVRTRLAEKDSFEQAVRVGLIAVMSSPKFLFLTEKPGKLDDFALASRLSYFLWNSMPDEELLSLAKQGKLSQPRTLRQQVERLLNDPKSAAFATNFCGQWLNLRDIEATDPSQLYLEWDEMLKLSMVRETELFFTEILKNDLSLTNFAASDFSMLNGRLAEHYGIPGVEGTWRFRKVTLPANSHRGGVLTMASVLKVTADGTNTSPVKRGVWVLERILGTPPPKQPADVPPLPPDIRGAKTIRERLAKHRSDTRCASCHVKIDPPGFALESFDVIGGWREYYRVGHWGPGVKEVPGKKYYLRGPDVDAAGVTADGQKFRNIDEFKRLLLRDKDQIARALAEKLATYATGGPPTVGDKAEIDAIVAKVRGKNYGLRTLVHEIVQSKMFQHK